MKDSLALLMSPPCSPAHAAERRLHPEKQIHISKATVVFALCPCNMAIGSLQVTSNTFSNEKSLKKQKKTNPKHKPQSLCTSCSQLHIFCSTERRLLRPEATRYTFVFSRMLVNLLTR